MNFIVAKILCPVLVLFSCSRPDKKIVNNKEVNNTIKEKFYLRSAIKAMAVSKNYVYCDSTVKGDLSCFVEYNGKKYLKREKLSFDSIGILNTVTLFKPEGNRNYNKEDLLGDTLLVETSGWKISNNIIEINGNKLMKPFSGTIVEMNEAEKTIYFLSESMEEGKEFLYVYVYW